MVNAWRLRMSLDVFVLNFTVESYVIFNETHVTRILAYEEAVEATILHHLNAFAHQGFMGNIAQDELPHVNQTHVNVVVASIWTEVICVAFVQKNILENFVI